jgi:nitrile hydratase
MTSHEHDHDHTKPPSQLELRVKALESLLVERKIVEAAALDTIVDAYENKIGPRNGAAVVARAWVDPDYKVRLFADSTAAIAELGFFGPAGRRPRSGREHARGT